jgi:hypothetical protein
MFAVNVTIVASNKIAARATVSNLIGNVTRWK